jgi:porin
LNIRPSGYECNKTYPLWTQYVLESFYRIQLYSILQVTPDIQFIINPSINPEQDLIVACGIRFRVAF